ncbi:metalloregulator ArsR/SmtB family transcription factor [Pontivivens ytuae]|uniref:Metalloregulator ArsR/SmtB family transcription factor n=2 Tax=Pontivivens ytuae TaxID=2789856 RepID=A0A7S9LTC0_9RHOB|nr:metalloregulator ArsR/SmtB family transcription factor [Pontivivens ytuae]QPH54899.1 metalloregulator ArsR/SmtB family transcription factor [Pontivivens ytuae]
MDGMVDRFGALAHAQRMQVFRLLAGRAPAEMTPGEMVERTGLPASTLSAYLARLADARLIRARRDGTRLYYSVQPDTVREMLEFLVFDCCNGQPELCEPLIRKQGSDVMQDTFKVLFVCTGNSARSIIAETLLRELGGARFEAYSAGTKPFSELNPHAVEMLEGLGHDTSGLRAKNISEFESGDAPAFDFVFTVCNRDAGEECPPWEGQPVSAHWGMPDPVKVEGTDAEKALAFKEAYRTLRSRIEAFVNLPVSSLDAVSLQSAVDAIGEERAAE